MSSLTHCKPFSRSNNSSVHGDTHRVTPSALSSIIVFPFSLCVGISRKVSCGGDQCSGNGFGRIDLKSPMMSGDAWQNKLIPNSWSKPDGSNCKVFLWEV